MSDPDLKVVPDVKPPATELEPNDGLTFLRFQALRARALAASTSAAAHAMQHNEAQRLSVELAGKAEVLIVPLREKYGLGESDQVDDETFAIRRGASK